MIFNRCLDYKQLLKNGAFEISHLFELLIIFNRNTKALQSKSSKNDTLNNEFQQMFRF